MESMPESFIYMTAPNMDEATRIGRALVEERLVACVNLLDRMTSIYWWQGKIDESAEVAIIAKTREDLVEPLIARVKELHSYECPCVIALPITAGNADYLAWIQNETRSPE
jgi:periplasmic divalent cation tolerance protein